MFAGSRLMKTLKVIGVFPGTWQKINVSSCSLWWVYCEHRIPLCGRLFV